MKVTSYVVNLERAVGRREEITKQLQAAGISPEFLGAIDAKEVGKEYFMDRFNDFGPWGVVPVRNMAICSSHRRIWEHFLQTDSDLALIFEDDIHVAPELGAWVSDLSWWPEDADIVRLERWNSQTMRHILAKKGKTFRGRKIARIFTRHPGAAAYFLTRTHAQRLVDQKKISLTTDGFLFNPYVSPTARIAKIYQVEPSLVMQGNDPRQERSRRTSRPEGMIRLRQKLNRGWAELRATPRHLMRLASGQAEFVRLNFSKEPMIDVPPHTGPEDRS